MAALPEGQDIFSVDQIADYLGVSRRTVLNLLNRGHLDGFRIGRLWKIRRQAVDQFVETRENAQRKRKG